MRYFIGKNGRQLGPFDGQQVRDQLTAGTIGYDDLLWREGMPAWAPVRTEFPPLSAASLPPPGMATASPFNNAPPPPAADASASAPGNPFLSASRVGDFPSTPTLADRGTRLGAVLLDGLVNLVACGPGLVWLVVTFIALDQSGRTNPGPEAPDLDFAVRHLAGPLLLTLIPLLVVVSVQIWLLSTRGQSLGKMWLKIRIVRIDGTPVGFVHAVLLRSGVMQLLGAIPGVGGLIALVDPLLIFREDRRCLHDLIAGTTVVNC